MVTLKVNKKEYNLDIEDKTPLLWALREQCGLTGTKFGCGVSMCGACTVLVDGEPQRTCTTKVSGVAGQEITTIEGLAEGGELHAIQKAWIECQAPQCGYCQSGQILLAVGLLKSNANPSDADIEGYMSENICRCGSYNEIKAAIKRAAQILAGG